MFKNAIRIVIALLGALIGYGLMVLLFDNNLLIIQNSILKVAVYVLASLIFGGIGLFAANKITNILLNVLDSFERNIIKQPPVNIAFGAIGLLFGLILAYFVSVPIRLLNIPFIGEVVGLIITIIIFIIFGTVGSRLMIRYKNEIMDFFKINIENKSVEKQRRLPRNKKEDRGLVSPKILDTSVIIDGRILNIAESGFIDGDLIVPEFVLEELQFIADSSDDLKRERGRRGLDIVKKLQKVKNNKVIICNRDFPEVNEVDIKLLKLTLELEGKVVTNDYNLNKVASVQSIPVLNINNLANAVKTIVIPGEFMNVNVIKEGKEKRQGLAYLEDGTMIVVEEGKDYIGDEIKVQVTTILQTAAGKMIFAKPV